MGCQMQARAPFSISGDVRIEGSKEIYIMIFIKVRGEDEDEEKEEEEEIAEDEKEEEAKEDDEEEEKDTISAHHSHITATTLEIRGRI